MKDQKGFTLIEILVAVGIFVVVILLAGNIFTLSRQLSTRNSTLAELLQNSRVVIDRMSREIRQAAIVITDISSTTPSHEIMFQDGHDLSRISYIRYRLDDTDLIREDITYYFNTDPNVLVYHDAIDPFGNPAISTTSALLIGEYFTNLDLLNNEGLLTMDFSLSKGTKNFALESQVYIRNW